jgi:hypothetical protein
MVRQPMQIRRPLVGFGAHSFFFIFFCTRIFFFIIDGASLLLFRRQYCRLGSHGRNNKASQLFRARMISHFPSEPIQK